jgi:hypothetical protein
MISGDAAAGPVQYEFRWASDPPATVDVAASATLAAAPILDAAIPPNGEGDDDAPILVWQGQAPA